jgi:ATP-dependent 26S proteasome regulatory subunit
MKQCHREHLEIPLPNEQARLDILKIHAAPIAKRGDIGNHTGA